MYGTTKILLSTLIVPFNVLNKDRVSDDNWGERKSMVYLRRMNKKRKLSMKNKNDCINLK